LCVIKKKSLTQSRKDPQRGNLLFALSETLAPLRDKKEEFNAEPQRPAKKQCTFALGEIFTFAW
ncbi:MAG: hypothetical protein ABJA78_16725, partial [Ferruginibacter sp.]